MKLVVGLGNPGVNYQKTRHNVGYSFLDYYLKEKGFEATFKKSMDGESYITNINGEKVIFLKPLTFMNLSGICVLKYVNYYSIDIDDILVISDDLDLLLGNFKLKLNGSSGGHNGLKSIESSLSSSSYKRLKIGISKDKSIDTVDYVLGKFSKDDIDVLEKLFKELVNVLDDYFQLPFLDLMNKYNKKNR